MSLFRCCVDQNVTQRIVHHVNLKLNSKLPTHVVDFNNAPQSVSYSPATDWSPPKDDALSGTSGNTSSSGNTSAYCRAGGSSIPGLLNKPPGAPEHDPFNDYHSTTLNLRSQCLEFERMRPYGIPMDMRHI
jgi:hypothetical protein